MSKVNPKNKKKRKIIPVIGGFKAPLKIQNAYPMDAAATAKFKKAVKEQTVTKFKYAYRTVEAGVKVIKSITYDIKAGGFYISKKGELISLLEPEQNVVVDTLDAKSLAELLEARQGNKITDGTIEILDDETLEKDADELEEELRIKRVKESAKRKKQDGDEFLDGLEKHERMDLDNE